MPKKNKFTDEDCLFCNIPPVRIVLENELAYAVRDGYPVTEMHSLIIPKRHIQDYFDLTTEELIACDQLIRSLKDEISNSDNSVNGFNIGMNSGETAGQTIFHCHIHLIPRRTGDVDNPRGGIRNIIPDMGNY